MHEVGRNADFFDPKSARLLKAGSSIVSDSVHLHSNGRDTTAHLEIGFKFMPKGYKPEYRRATYALGNGVDIDIKAMEANQQLHAYAVLKENTKILSFEPHLHAPGTRMCLEAIWGYNIQTLNCVGYDHNWVRGYDYDDDSAPLLPKDTILHIVGYMDNSPSNKNVPDPRNWQGSGNRSVANMFIDLGNRVSLTDEQFQAEMAARREKLKLTRNSMVIGCPLCNIPPPAATDGEAAAVMRRLGHAAGRQPCEGWRPGRWATAARSSSLLLSPRRPARSRCRTRAGRTCRPPTKAGRRTPTARSTSSSAT